MQTQLPLAVKEPPQLCHKCKRVMGDDETLWDVIYDDADDFIALCDDCAAFVGAA